MNKTILKEFNIRYKADKRSRSVKIRAAEFNTLDITYPPSLSLNVVNDIIVSRADSIRNAYNKVKASSMSVDSFVREKNNLLRIADSVLYFEKSSDPKLNGLTKIKNGDRIFYFSKNDGLKDPDTARLAAKSIIMFCTKCAKKILPQTVKKLADKHGFSYNNLSFRNQKRRWGSCSHDNNLSLNVRLMLLPYKLIEYVLIHELVHTIHKNHSSTYWDAVIRILPDAKLLRKQLKKYDFTFLDRNN